MKKIKKIILFGVLGILSIPVLYWTFVLVKCEILTMIHYDEFEYAYADNTMLDEMEYFKVLSYDENNAKVYYVSEGMTMANVLTFEKKNDQWVEVGWNTIWSSTGSASEVIFPYWWHFIYGGL